MEKDTFSQFLLKYLLSWMKATKTTKAEMDNML